MIWFLFINILVEGISGDYPGFIFWGSFLWKMKISSWNFHLFLCKNNHHIEAWIEAVIKYKVSKKISLTFDMKKNYKQNFGKEGFNKLWFYEEAHFNNCNFVNGQPKWF